MKGTMSIITRSQLAVSANASIKSNGDDWLYRGSIGPYCNEHKMESLCSVVMTMAIEHPSKRTTSSWGSRCPCYLDGLRFHSSRRCCCFFGCLPSVLGGSCKRNGARDHASVLHPCNSGSNTWDGPGIWRSSAKVWGPPSISRQQLCAASARRKLPASRNYLSVQLIWHAKLLWNSSQVLDAELIWQHIGYPQGHQHEYSSCQAYPTTHPNKKKPTKNMQQRWT